VNQNGIDVARGADLLSSAAAPTAEFAYVDETGDSGDMAQGGSRTYTLGCVLAPIDHWTDRLDLLSEVRRGIKDTYQIRMRDELKANYLIRPRGPLKNSGLGDGQLRDIYRRMLNGLNVVSSGVFAVVIDKEHLQSGYDPAERAWHFLLQRLRIRSQLMSHPIIVVHDEGEDKRVRRWHRAFRRHSYDPQGRRVQAKLLVEDPVPRASILSYFVQAADLVAYAAFRRVQPPMASKASVCDRRCGKPFVADG